MNNEKLPNSDQDLLLAREIRQSRESGSDLSDIDNPLLALLLQYRRVKHSAHTETAVPGDRMWSTIELRTRESGGMPEEQTGRTSATVYRLFTGKTAVWAAAATIIIAAFIGIYYYQQQPVLLAQTASQIETVTLADGSEVTMRPYSELYKVDGREQQQHYRLNGEAHFNVEFNPDRTFSVEAGSGLVSVLGTEFTLSDWGKTTQVYLQEGSVRFSKRQDTASVILEPGQSSSITEEGDLSEPVTASPSEYTDWMQNELVYHNKPAGEVFDELEQQFNISISAPDNVLNTRISGTLVLGEKEETLELAAMAIGGSFETSDGKNYRFIPDED